MREKLEEYNNKLVTLKGHFIKYGRKKDPEDECSWNTLILTKLKFEDGTPACDHLWFIAKKEFLRRELRTNAYLQVSGFVSMYERGNNSKDFGIKDYTDVQVLSKGDVLKPSKFWNYRGFSYFKFILDSGTRWYRLGFGNMHRIVYEKVGEGFNEYIIPYDVDDIIPTKAILDMKQYKNSDYKRKYKTIPIEAKKIVQAPKSMGIVKTDLGSFIGLSHKPTI